MISDVWVYFWKISGVLLGRGSGEGYFRLGCSLSKGLGVGEVLGRGWGV